MRAVPGRAARAWERGFTSSLLDSPATSKSGYFVAHPYFLWQALLFISGGEDHLMPPVVQHSNAAHYKAEETLTEVKVFEGRSHLLPAQRGWEEIADTTSSALQRIYLGQGQIEPTLKEAAEKANAILKK